MFDTQRTINCNGILLDLEIPRVMGILNVTPDSFYDGGRYQEKESILAQVEKMVTEGADIIDIGGMSSRPGADIIGIDEELKRVIPAVEAVSKRFPETVISIDTIHSKVAVESIGAGAHLVNDISAGKMDDKMYETVARLGIPYILMHMQGRPSDMQEQPVYEDVVQEVLDFFIQETGQLRALGVKDVILDPGFGFGKSVDHNYQLLKKMEAFQILDCPVLTGVSRKSMINKVLNISPREALNGTTALHMVALMNGSQLLRVHDVKEAKQTVRLWQALYNA
jgi:dihydropteroate synthase